MGVNSVQLQKQILLQLTEGGHRTEIFQSNLRISQFCMYLVDKKHSCVGYRTLGSAVLCRDGDTPESAVLCRDRDTPESAVQGWGYT